MNGTKQIRQVESGHMISIYFKISTSVQACAK